MTLDTTDVLFYTTDVLFYTTDVLFYLFVFLVSLLALIKVLSHLCCNVPSGKCGPKRARGLLNAYHVVYCVGRGVGHNTFVVRKVV